MEGLKPFLHNGWWGGVAILGAMTQRMRTFRRRAKRRMCVSKSTSPVWCVVYAKSPLHAHAPSVSADSGPPPSGTTQEASAASQSASGFLPKGRQRSCTENTKSEFINCKHISGTFKVPENVSWCLNLQNSFTPIANNVPISSFDTTDYI